MRLASETATTSGALIGSLIEMSGLMLLASTPVSKDLLTEMALKRLFSCVNVQMFFQRPFICKLFATMSAGDMLFFHSMAGHVVFEKFFLTQFLATERAHDRATTGGPLWPIMDHHLLLVHKFLATEGTLQSFLFWVLIAYMVGKTRLLCKLFPAEETTVGLFTCVSLDVPLQVIESSKCFVTYVTLIWLFPRVNAHVRGKVALLSEPLATDRTPVRLLPQVDQHMGSQ